MSLNRSAGTPANATQNVGNAILVNAELVRMLRSALKKSANSIDRIPSDREILDLVVSKTFPLLKEHLIYSRARIEKDSSYQWFGSEVAKRVSACNDIVDKGRFVNACIIAYLWGDAGLAKYCVPSRLIRPRGLSNEETLRIRTKAAEIADAKDVDSGFEPTTHPLSEGDSISLD